MFEIVLINQDLNQHTFHFMRLKPFIQLVCVALCCLATGSLYAQNNTNQSAYDAHNLWKPFFYPHNGNDYRSATGAPGPKYWQNSADYKINCTLDTTEKRLTGSVVISYKNNSPDNLSFLWLQMDQNIYREDSRGEATSPVTGGRFANRKFTQGYELKSVTVEQNGKSEKADYIINDTRMQIRLKNDLKAKGGAIKIKVDYAFTIPEYGTDRMGRLDTKNGWIYEIAQWYPRMEVYDDVEGWNTIPYMGAGEFYLEYGNIDYTIKAPANMVIVGSGELMNPDQVLTAKERSRLEQARNSDKTVFIHSASDVTDPGIRPQSGTRTWHFLCKNTRDVAWAASKAFIWDAARINLPNGKKALAQSVYPSESAGDSAWGSSTAFTKACIEFYSKYLGYSFTYPSATNVAGNVHGMEYPGIVFCGYKYTGEGLWGVTIHEFGHNWFPMIVGSNERKYPFMDEGFNTYINDMCTKWYDNGKFFHKTDHHNEASYTFSDDADPILTIPDVTQSYNLGVAAYSKPAFGLELLRNVILGKDRFDYAFQQYVDRWAFKHPTPWDFFRTIENASGEDLAWFWREWFFDNDRLDQGIKDVKYIDNDPAKGALITLVNEDKMALPVIVEIKDSDGQDTTFTLPVEIWQRGDTWTFKFGSTTKLSSVTLDPDHQLPDYNDSNNEWKQVEKKPAPPGVTAQSIITKYIEAIGGETKLNGVKDMTFEASGSVQGQEIVFKREYLLPDKFKMEVSVPAMNDQVISKVVLNGDSVTMQRMGQDMPVQENTKETLKDEMNIFPEQQYLKTGYTLSLEGIETVDDQDAYVLKVTDSRGNVVTQYYNVKTGLRVKEVSEQATTAGTTTKSSTTYSNYQEVNGIKFPFTIGSDGGGVKMIMKVKDIKINSGVSPDDFK